MFNPAPNDRYKYSRLNLGFWEYELNSKYFNHKEEVWYLEVDTLMQRLFWDL